MKIILASKSGVRKKILDKNNIKCEVIPSNVDEDEVKASLLSEGADPLTISKNLAEIKSIKVSSKNPDKLVLGADSVISLNNKLINKPKSRSDALSILKTPKIELHISNIYNREEFRQKSMISGVVTGGIFGLGTNGYILAINAMQDLLKNGN